MVKGKRLFGEKIKNSLPEDIQQMERTPFSKTLLTVTRRYHKAEANKAHSRDLAKEIMSDFPDMAEEYNYKLGRISFGIIFAIDNSKAGLVWDGLVKMDYDEDDARRYWVE